jgi:hypothetical protein
MASINLSTAGKTAPASEGPPSKPPRTVGPEAVIILRVPPLTGVPAAGVVVVVDVVVVVVVVVWVTGGLVVVVVCVTGGAVVVVVCVTGGGVEVVVVVVVDEVPQPVTTKAIASKTIMGTISNLFTVASSLYFFSLLQIIIFKEEMLGLIAEIES